MSDKWRHIGSAESALGKLLPPYKELVENIETGERRAVLVGSYETVGDAIAKGQWADDDNVKKSHDDTPDSNLTDLDNPPPDPPNPDSTQPNPDNPPNESPSYGESPSYTYASEGNGSGAAVYLLVIVGVLVALWFGSQTGSDKPVKNPIQAPTTSQYDKPEPIFKMRVVAPLELNVRNGPGTQFEIYNKVYNNDIVEVYETNNGWYHIGSGWVNSKFLTHVDSASKETELARGNGIPKQFQGEWASPEDCTINSDSIIKITDYSIDYWESGCELKSIKKLDNFSFSGVFSCNGEGETETRQITLTKKDDKLIYRSPPALSRCSIKK